jgi:hypothetical protein
MVTLMWGPLVQIRPVKAPSQMEKLCRVRFERLHTAWKNMRVPKAQAGSYVVRRQINFWPKPSVGFSHTPTIPQPSAISHTITFDMACTFILRCFYYFHHFLAVARR